MPAQSRVQQLVVLTYVSICQSVIKKIKKPQFRQLYDSYVTLTMCIFTQAYLKMTSGSNLCTYNLSFLVMSLCIVPIPTLQNYQLSTIKTGSDIA